MTAAHNATLLERSAERSRSAPTLARIWKAWRRPVTRLVFGFSFIFIWEASVRLGWVDPLFLSSPSQVVARLIEVFADGSIWPHIWATATTAFWGFVSACVIGIPIGVLMGRSEFVRDALEPFIVAQASVPTVALLPLFIIWLGIGEGARVVLVFASAVFGIVVSTEAGVKNVDERLIETARSFTGTEWEILWKIVMPASIPYIIAGMRLTVARVLIMVVVAELYGSTAGIGYLIFQAGAGYDTSMIFVGVVILAAAGIILNSLLRLLERSVAPWQAAHK
ncbi:MAG TPA: ABC transporter permease [Stellaceae bacterium]|jgi:ABC-type nitrate/sulfonate/bicarbonate transport system permease component|nr:ABC transporter permease [Stellaceae bacterium]